MVSFVLGSCALPRRQCYDTLSYMAEIEERRADAPADVRGRPDEAQERSVPGYLVAAGFALLVAVMAYFAFGMPGMDHGSSTEETSAMAGMDHDAAAAGFAALEPDAFAARAAKNAAFVVNVHVPFDGEISGTDEHIPYDRIVTSRALPSDRRTAILVYCRTGAMSTQAARALVAAGYTDVAHLRGGMDAWEAAGRRVLDSE
jgi:phage shock protein E